MNAINIKRCLLSALLVVFAGSLFAIAIPQTVSAVNPGEPCSQSFLGFPTWYRGLITNDGVADANGNCNLTSPTNGTDGLSSYIWHIVLNVIEIVMMLIVYISVIFIIYGGILFITSAGSAEGVKKAKASITNAVIGLVISIVAVAIVEFIFSQLGAM